MRETDDVFFDVRPFSLVLMSQRNLLSPSSGYKKVYSLVL